MGFPLMGTHGEMARMRMGATRLNMPLDEYIAKREAGQRWCFRCQAWQPVALFGTHPRRADGLDSQCLESARKYAREHQRRKRGTAA